MSPLFVKTEKAHKVRLERELQQLVNQRRTLHKQADRVTEEIIAKRKEIANERG